MRSILASGMFDMRNFGDLMFPLVAARELGVRGFNVHALSPTGATVNLRDAAPSRNMRAALDVEAPCHGILIGGGYIVHSHPMDFLAEYREGQIGAAAAPSVWLGATLAAALLDVPIAWNAPGAPHPLRPAVRELASVAFAAADYLSLRDRGSAKLVGAENAVIVPDPILGLSQLWPREVLAPDFLRLCGKLGVKQVDGVLAVHVRRRSIGKASLDELSDILADRCKNLGLTPVMIGVGSAHGDDLIARHLCRRMLARGFAAACLDEPEALRDIAALIAYARGYVGSSLHGYVAAVSYGVSALLVARPAYRKFDGLLGQIDRMCDRMLDWNEAIEALPTALEQAHHLSVGVLKQLERHWDKVAAAFESGPEMKRRARLDFAALALQEGISQLGMNWAMTPFTTARDRAASLDDEARMMEPF